MQNPVCKKSTLIPLQYGVYFLILFCLTPTACVDKQEILKEGRRVVIPGGDISMDGILYGPEDPGKSDPAVIILHGWLEAGKNGADEVSIVAWHLAREGYVALALSMRGWPGTGGQDDCGEKQPFDVAEAVE